MGAAMRLELLLLIPIGLAGLVWLVRARKRRMDERRRQLVQLSFDRPLIKPQPGETIRATYKDEEGNLRHRTYVYKPKDGE
jgi:hypothetical protein